MTEVMGIDDLEPKKEKPDEIKTVKNVRTVEFYIENLSEEDKKIIDATSVTVQNICNTISPRIKSIPLYIIQRRTGNVWNEWYKDFKEVHSHISIYAIHKVRQSFLSSYEKMKTEIAKAESEIETLDKKIKGARTKNKKNKFLRKKAKYLRYLGIDMKDKVAFATSAQKLTKNPFYRFPSFIPFGKSIISFLKEGNDYFVELRTIRIGDSNRFQKIKLKIKSSQYSDDIVEKLINGDLRYGSGEYILRGKKFNVTVSEDIPKPVYKPSTFIGVDLGLVKMATVVVRDEGGNILETKFFSGKEAKHMRRRYRITKKSINRHVDIGYNDKYNIHTENKKRRKKRGVYGHIRRHESNWMINFNHFVSIEIIRLAQKYPNPRIQLEDLTGIKNIDSKDIRTSFWAYARLREMIEYKAKTAGILLKIIEPKYTSQTCSKCGHVDKDNRITQSRFKCLQCGNQLNADFNAASNIATWKKT